MDSMVFRAALRASAKVALTASLSACGGAVQTSNGETPDAFAETSPGTVTAEAAAPSDAGRATSACEPPPVASLLPEQNHPDAAVADDTLGCCLHVLAASSEQPDGYLPILTDAAAHDPAVLGCCAAVVVRLDSDYSGSSVDAAARDRAEIAEAGFDQTYDPAGCCEALSSQLALYPSGPTCSPWGPPMPPAMPGVA